MRTGIIARNYADTLLALAERTGGRDAMLAYDGLMEQVAAMVREAPRIRAFLASPLVAVAQKRAAVRKAFQDRVPASFLHFLLVVVDHRRAGLFEEIADAYRGLVDEAAGRVRADVTFARPGDEAVRAAVRGALEQRLDKTVVATYRVDSKIMGGVVIRVDEEILDGSLRRRMARMRRQLLTGARNGAR